MAMQRMTLRQWKTMLGQAVPLDQVPRLCETTPTQVAHGIRRGDLVVHTFKAGDGRVFRMVRLADVSAFKRKQPKLTMEGLARAFKAMMNSKPVTPR